MNSVRKALVLIYFLLAPACWAELQASLPLPKTLAETLVSGFFPRSIATEQGSLLLKDPSVLFLDDNRLGLRTDLQSTASNVGIKDEDIVEGAALVSCTIAYDQATAQLLLQAPRLDSLVLYTDDKTAARLRESLQRSWNKQSTDPLRVDLPKHPYLAPFKDGIQDIIVEDEVINVRVRLP